MQFIYPKNWEQFQHYKERKPPWIKLHEKILDDYDFHCLPVASRALAPLLWLLAREYDKGMIPYDVKAISFRMRMSEDDLKKTLAPLISSGFFNTSQDASTVLAPCNQVVIVETETEAYKEEAETKTETFFLPEWIPLKTWNDFLDMRKKIKKPITDEGKKIAVSKLGKFKEKGYDVVEIIETSTMNNWSGFFEPKEKLSPKKEEYAPPKFHTDERGTFQIINGMKCY